MSRMKAIHRSHKTTQTDRVERFWRATVIYRHTSLHTATSKHMNHSGRLMIRGIPWNMDPQVVGTIRIRDIRRPRRLLRPPLPPSPPSIKQSPVDAPVCIGAHQSPHQTTCYPSPAHILFPSFTCCMHAFQLSLSRSPRRHSKRSADAHSLCTKLPLLNAS